MWRSGAAVTLSVRYLVRAAHGWFDVTHRSSRHVRSHAISLTDRFPRPQGDLHGDRTHAGVKALQLSGTLDLFAGMLTRAHQARYNPGFRLSRSEADIALRIDLYAVEIAVHAALPSAS